MTIVQILREDDFISMHFRDLLYNFDELVLKNG